jgi:hypothetical protein
MNFKKTVAGVLLTGILAGTVPIVPVDLQWTVSYETLQFDTASGDLGFGQYAVALNASGGWYVRVVPDDQGNFQWTEDPKDVEGKVEVAIRCDKCAYYDEFSDGVRTYRLAETQSQYDKLRYIPDAAQPAKEKLVPLLQALTPEARAAIAFDATTTASGTELSASSASWSHTSTGSNLAMAVGIQITSPTTPTSLSSATYNSVAMTLATSSNWSGAVPREVALYYLAAPTTGANSVAVTLDSTHTFNAQAITLTGVAQTGTLDAISTQATGATNQPIATTTTIAANAWIIDVAIGRNITPPIAANGLTQTQRYGATTGVRTYAFGTLGATTPGDYGVAWTSGLAASGITAMSFAPFVSAPSTPLQDDGQWFQLFP